MEFHFLFYKDAHGVQNREGRHFIIMCHLPGQDVIYRGVAAVFYDTAYRSRQFFLWTEQNRICPHRDAVQNDFRLGIHFQHRIDPA